LIIIRRRKMKKIICIILIAALSVCMLAACSRGGSSANTTAASENGQDTTASAGSEQTLEQASEPSGEGKTVVGLFFSLEGEYFTLLDDMLRKGLEERGYKYESQSSNFNPVMQIEQIENAVAKKVDMIWIWSVDGRQVHDALKAAIDQGVLVYSFVQNPGDDAATMVRGTDETICGATLAAVTVEWADKEFGEDAEEGSIRTLLLACENSENQKIRSDVCEEKLKEDPRFDILERATTDGSTVNTQALVENMFSTYGDTIDCIVTSGGEDGLGVCAYLTSESCIVSDPEKIGNISVEISSEIADYMAKGIVDAVAVNGGNIINNIATQVDEMDKLMKGEIEGGFSAVDIGRCTPDNLAEYGY